MLGATPGTYTAEQIEYIVRGRGDPDLRAGQLPSRACAASISAAGARDRRGRQGADRHAGAVGRRGQQSGLRRRCGDRPDQPTDVLMLVSGTTGPPKGVQRCSSTCCADRGLRGAARGPARWSRDSWPPSAHYAERNAHHYIPVVFGMQITCCEDRGGCCPTCPVRRDGSSRCPASGEAEGRARTMTAGQPAEEREKIEAALDAGVSHGAPGTAPGRRSRRPRRPGRRPDEEIFAGLRRTPSGSDQVEAINVGAAPTP